MSSGPPPAAYGGPPAPAPYGAPPAPAPYGRDDRGRGSSGPPPRYGGGGGDRREMSPGELYFLSLALSLYLPHISLYVVCCRCLVVELLNWRDHVECYLLRLA
jgi:hypothetical protein